MPISILCFLAGILSVQQMTLLPGWNWLVAGLVILCMIVILRWWRVAFFIAGFLWAVVFATVRLNEQLSEQLAGQDIQIEGYIADLPEHNEHIARFNFKVEHTTQIIPHHLRLTWYYPDQPIKAGQKWSLTVRLKRPHGNFNPGGFDYERWLFVEGIGATGYVRPKPEPKILNTETPFGFLPVRQAIVEQLQQLLSESKNLALVKALTIGDGDSISSEQWEIFRKTGTTHLMVISGSHIGLIAGLTYMLVLRIWAWTGILAWSPQKMAAIAALIMATLYAGLTGFSVPAQRSALMIAIAMIAIVQQRNTRPYSILAVALLAVLCIDPLVVLSAGFWLSFIAVSLIIYTLAGRLEKLGFFRASIKVNWVTSLGLAPLLLVFFQQVSLIAPIANLIAVPIIGLIVVPLALVATLIMFILPVLSVKLFWLVNITLQGLWWVLCKLAELPLATVAHTQPSWWMLSFAILGLLLLLAPKGVPSRWLGLIMLLPLVFTTVNPVQSGTIKMTLLDVGQGLSAVVQTANHVLVYDTGAKFSSTSDSGQSVIVPFLRSQGINHIDTLLVSHGDNDHIGGVESLMKLISVQQVLTSVPQQLNHYAPTQCQVGQSWLWDDVKFSILSPKLNTFSSDNDNSCVLQIQAQQGTVLLSGDIEAAAESWLVDTYNTKLKANVLVAPHHGSETSSTFAFLKAVQPDAILIPAGYRNPFGHPHSEVLKRYKVLNINWLDSVNAGAIEVGFVPTITIKSWRSAAGRYWNYQE